MKCINTNGIIKRVSDETAATLVMSGKATYSSKLAWKQQERPGYKPDANFVPAKSTLQKRKDRTYGR